jgi:hypothetical protein
MSINGTCYTSVIIQLGAGRIARTVASGDVMSLLGMTNYWFLWLGPGTPLILAGLVWWIIELFRKR